LGKRKNEPDRIVYTGGKEFRLYKYYDELSGDEILDYPNFQESPEYTSDGRPFTLAVQESCEYGRDDNDSNDPDPGDCGGCVWFHREAAYDPIGVCMCEEIRRF